MICARGVNLFRETENKEQITMSDNSIFGNTFQIMGNSMDLMLKRHQVISSNLANEQTPGYTAARLKFEDELQSRISGSGKGPRATHPRHLPAGNSFSPVQGRIERMPDRTGIGDGNNVSRVEEMMKMSENRIRYEAVSQILKQRFAMIEYVLQK